MQSETRPKQNSFDAVRSATPFQYKTHNKHPPTNHNQTHMLNEAIREAMPQTKLLRCNQRGDPFSKQLAVKAASYQTAKTLCSTKQSGKRRPKRNSVEAVRGTRHLQNKHLKKHPPTTPLKPYAQRCSAGRDALNEAASKQSEARRPYQDKKHNKHTQQNTSNPLLSDAVREAMR